MKYLYTCCLFLLLIGGSGLFISCHHSQRTKNQQYKDSVFRDLPEIKKEGILHVITLYNSTSYFLYKGRPMGYQFEMVERLAASLGLKIKMVVAKSFSQVFDLLRDGKGDLIAFGLTITKARKEKVAFTHYLYTSHQVLVQRKPENWRTLSLYKIKQQLVSSPFELIGDTVYLGRETSYIPRIKHLENEIGGEIPIKIVDSGKTVDDVIHMVAEGKADYTVADYNLAAVNKMFYPILDIGVRISLSQRIAWAVRKSSPRLLDTLNNWISKAKKKRFYFHLYRKYFEDERGYRKRVSSPLFSKNDGMISPYDSLIQKYAKTLGWDWRLLCSQIYQESKFNTHDEGWAGARGLMQIMPETAEELGIKNITHPEENIEAGARYLKNLYNHFGKVKDSIQRIKFTLASYNCGLGHVRDAQRLAKSLGDSAYYWDHNVEKAILKLQERKYFTQPEIRHGIVQGILPYKYVRDIFDRYHHYQELIPLKKGGS